MPLLALLLVGVAGMSATPAHLAEETTDVAGVYMCDGVNPEGNPYRGIVEIVKTQETFQVRWTFPQSDDSALGIGILSNGVLAVSYYGGATAGVVVYKIAEGQKMVGQWTVTGANGGVFNETLTKLPGHMQRAPRDDNHRPADRNQRRTPIRGDSSKLIEG
jgi:hypothetical protein